MRKESSKELCVSLMNQYNSKKIAVEKPIEVALLIIQYCEVLQSDRIRINFI